MEFRPSAADKPIMWDVISDAPMSTEHACARFLLKEVAQTGWAMFCDGDVLFRDNAARIFEGLDSSKAVYCVKHGHKQKSGTKMDGMIQTIYPKKNWSSVMIMNLDHPSNQNLTAEYVNTIPGRELHAFCWLKEDEIGELPREWNYLVGVSDHVERVSLAHFTLGLPDMDGYQSCEFSDEWRSELIRWAI
jgi:lipopolysaccharide biosynthesis glycosyltransferase